jgi:hypothetical protein
MVICMCVCYGKLILTDNGNRVFQDTLRAYHPYLSTKSRSHQSAEPHSRSSTYLIPAMAADGEIATKPLSTPACEQITHPYASTRALTPQNTPICTQFPKRACERPVILPIRARTAWPLEDPAIWDPGWPAASPIRENLGSDGRHPRPPADRRID